MNATWDKLLQVLVHVQAQLDGPLTTVSLARRGGLSPSHFHRLFTAQVGETPRGYVERLRLEQSAFRLLMYDGTLLDLAISCGYRSHETFTRAFSRHFGVPPARYRARVRQRTAQHRQVAEPTAEAVRGFALSNTRVVRLRPMHLAFIRHLGPYEDVPESLFDELDDWARRRRLAGPRVWVGLGHDAPVTTPPARLRFDASLVVPQPFSARGSVGYQYLDPGEVALTTHVGAPETLGLAYRSIFSRLLSRRPARTIGLPAIELYRASSAGPQFRITHTDICLPLVSTATGARR